MKYSIYDDRKCALGEGALWHPERDQLFWFDILSKKLLTSGSEWKFSEHVSAAGWIDRDTLLIASETALLKFNLESQAQEQIIALEEDKPKTRSNDGRADPNGGFWIGTMGKALEPGMGAIYRFYRGELRKIYDGLSVPNSICFAADGGHMYFSDTPTQKLMKQNLDADGWPDGEPFQAIDFSDDDLYPDGAVVDKEGSIWIAHWGAACVCRYDPNGRCIAKIELSATQITCPAFGNDSLYITSAADGVQEPDGGKTFKVAANAIGQKEHRIIL